MTSSGPHNADDQKLTFSAFITTLIKTAVAALAISYFLFALPLVSLLQSFGFMTGLYEQVPSPHRTTAVLYQDGIYAIRVFHPYLDRPAIAYAEKLITSKDDYKGHFIFVGPRVCNCEPWKFDHQCDLPTVYQGHDTPDVSDDQLEEMAERLDYPPLRSLR